ncbi:CGNR zinc finger domain-containing protein [Nonomuraea dietziae]|uniref:CGNR zinc finger domain-containing protein n=1 Tax=Nonomuraea dietziae TaxID=65515 RepID=UPI003CD0987F
MRLTSHGGLTPWHPHLDSATTTRPGGNGSSLVVHGSDGADLGHISVHLACSVRIVQLSGDVYLTQGSGLPRRYCSRRCATRERVASHRRSRAAR